MSAKDANQLVAVTEFDLVVVVSDVTTAARTSIAQLSPALAAKLLTLDANRESEIGDQIRARVGR